MIEEAVAAVRRFNRFYTRRIGVLDEGQHGSGFTLTEMRVLYELAHRDTPSAAEIAADLALDAGYLSRILKAFEAKGLIRREPDPTDARARVLCLAPAGRAAFAPLEAASKAMIARILEPLGADGRARVVEAMATVEALLGAEPPAPAPGEVVLRPHRAGDLGWVVSRHGALYAQEYGWDLGFEALVAEIAAQFLRSYDATRERAFIAERDGERLGCAFLVRADDETAKLRLLLVDPAARGLGLGKRLVEACTAFARETGYRRIRLWTNDCLAAARGIYAAQGYRLVATEPHHSFGHDLVGETWELEL